MSPQHIDTNIQYVHTRTGKVVKQQTGVIYTSGLETCQTNILG